MYVMTSMCPVKTLALNSVAAAIWIGFYPFPVTTLDADWFKDVLYFSSYSNALPDEIKWLKSYISESACQHSSQTVQSHMHHFAALGHYYNSARASTSWCSSSTRTSTNLKLKNYIYLIQWTSKIILLNEYISTHKCENSDIISICLHCCIKPKHVWWDLAIFE